MDQHQYRLVLKVLLFILRASVERNRLTPERSKERWAYYEKLSKQVKEEINRV